MDKGQSLCRGVSFWKSVVVRDYRCDLVIWSQDHFVFPTIVSDGISLISVGLTVRIPTIFRKRGHRAGWAIAGFSCTYMNEAVLLFPAQRERCCGGKTANARHPQITMLGQILACHNGLWWNIPLNDHLVTSVRLMRDAGSWSFLSQLESESKTSP